MDETRLNEIRELAETTTYSNMVYRAGRLLKALRDMLGMK